MFCELDKDESIIPNNDNDIILKNFDSIKNELEKLIYNNYEQNNIAKSTKQLINICNEPKNEKLKHTLDDILLMSQELDKNEYNNIQFDLEDYKLILDKKIMEPEFYGNYPLTYFWLLQNDKFKNGEIFLDLYNEIEKVNVIIEKKLPFWLFCLRIHSSLNFIISEYNYSHLDWILKSILYKTIYKKIKDKKNIGIKWIHLLKDNYDTDICDEFLNYISIFLKNIREDKQLNENLKKYGDENPINKSIFNNYLHLVYYCFDELYWKNSIFIFFSDINGQIKNELNNIAKVENKDYLIGGKYINSILFNIKGYKNNIENEKNKLIDNYNILKENIINSLSIYYNKEIELLKNSYTNLIKDYNSLINYSHKYSLKHSIKN